MKRIPALFFSLLTAAALMLGLSSCDVGAKFSIGGIDENGKYVETTTMLYSEPIPCRGLSVELAFDSNTDFRVFYYDENDVFLGSTEVLSEDYADDMVYASYCRILVMPRGDFVSIDDTRSDIAKYTDGITVKTAEVQYCDYTNNLYDPEDTVNINGIDTLILGIPTDNTAADLCLYSGDDLIRTDFIPTYKGNGYAWLEISTYGATQLRYDGGKGVKLYAHDSVSVYSFSAGKVDESGEVASNPLPFSTAATTDLFECQGLTVTPLANGVEYQIFWYNVDGLYFDKTDILTESFSPENVPVLARYARMQISKSALKAVEDTVLEGLTVKVDKEQAFDYDKLYDSISYEDFKNYGSLEEIDFEYALFIEGCTYVDSIAMGEIASSSFSSSTVVSTVILNLENVDRWQATASFVGESPQGFFSLDENYKKIPRSVIVSDDINGLLSWKDYGSYAILIFDSNSVIEFIPYLPRNEITEALYR